MHLSALAFPSGTVSREARFITDPRENPHGRVRHNILYSRRSRRSKARPRRLPRYWVLGPSNAAAASSSSSDSEEDEQGGSAAADAEPLI